MAVFGFGHASCEDLKIKMGRGVLDNEDFQKPNSSSGIKMHLKGGKRSSPGFSPQVGYGPSSGQRGHVDGGGERKGRKGGREPPARGGGALPSCPGTHTGRRGGLRTPLTYLQHNKDDI